MPINEHFRLCKQDELFHTGEECIDRVAEAANPSFPQQFCGFIMVYHCLNLGPQEVAGIEEKPSCNALILASRLPAWRP